MPLEFEYESDIDQNDGTDSHDRMGEAENSFYEAEGPYLYSYVFFLKSNRSDP